MTTKVTNGKKTLSLTTKVTNGKKTLSVTTKVTNGFGQTFLNTDGERHTPDSLIIQRQFNFSFTNSLLEFLDKIKIFYIRLALTRGLLKIEAQPKAYCVTKQPCIDTAWSV